MPMMQKFINSPTKKIMSHSIEQLHTFTRLFFEKTGCTTEDAITIADVFIAAEMRGIGSHGMIRISDYFKLWKAGRLNTRPVIKITRETVSTAVVDGDNAPGMLPAFFGMKLAIRKATACGTGWVSCFNSNHFGIAGYYAMMALEHDMIGICLTNANPLVAPTFSISRLLGTNPVAVAVPAGRQPPFVADFATTPIARGKLEVAVRKGESTLFGYVQDMDGNPSNDPDILRKGGAMLPLGGDREHGSHKGYCMGAIVDILSSMLSGAGFGPFVPPSVAYLPLPPPGNGLGTGHFFGAMSIDAFREKDEFKSAMDSWIETFRKAKSADGHPMVLIPGDIEREQEQVNKEKGIKLIPAVIADLNEIAMETGIEMKL
jgi:L-2-hydroxycarboxylate dehydrogenase (NAD+)